MQLRFHNQHSSPLSVAVMWWNPDGCRDDGNWGTRGWWNLQRGDTVGTNVWTLNRYFYFYAEGWDGTVWAGQYGPVMCSEHAFDRCLDIGSSGDDMALGMREVDAGFWSWSYVTFTVNLR